MKQFYFIMVFVIILASTSIGQVGINADNSAPDPSAILDVKSANTGMLISRMTTAERDAIASPIESLIIFNTTTQCFEAYNSLASKWETIRCLCCVLPVGPVAGTHLSFPAQITWNWNIVTSATGYKWNRVNDYGTATDMGMATTQTETGLACDSAYTRYVWAYNVCGNSTPVSLTQTTLFCCGSSLKINHTGGAVAADTKSVAYGTVTNIPGEPLKCWITSNLGASRQATAVNDATELSAGWYWQFNLKQGYMHDGTSVSPSWTVTTIYQNLDWEAANDPCTLELGHDWRIPTSVEWTNVDSYGTWTTMSDPFNSGLKIHAAGSLGSLYGSLYGRGLLGNYWTSAQSNYVDGNALFMGTGGCYMISNGSKVNGFSLRCIRDPGPPTVTTTAVSMITVATAICSGDVLNDGGTAITAKGICWSTLSNPTIADDHTDIGIGTGMFSSKLENLIPNTQYFFRAYATNSVNTAYGVELTFTTLTTGIPCPGIPTITINHIAGSVSPVSKTVTYGTVINIPGATSKCWITSNLGADNQATSKDDPSGSSAGWYWQFGLKQGYQHDGTTRTPNTTWITNINVNIGWLAVNDPCTIELGSGWRVPSIAEWENVGLTGNWTDWEDPWNSGLKIHSAGYLTYSSGSLVSRGSVGGYWSSTKKTATYGFNTFFYYGASGYLSDSDKAFGFSLRCLKD